MRIGEKSASLYHGNAGTRSTPYKTQARTEMPEQNLPTADRMPRSGRTHKDEDHDNISRDASHLTNGRDSGQINRAFHISS